MKAAVYHGPLDVRVEEVPEPGPLGSDEVLLAPLMGSLCGTDVTDAGRGRAFDHVAPDAGREDVQICFGAQRI